MKVRVDDELCTGHGRCYALAPELFEPDDEGMNGARGTTIDVPADKEPAAQLGVANCPEHAITIVD